MCSERIAPMIPPGKPPAAIEQADLQMHAALQQIRGRAARTARDDQQQRRAGSLGRCESEEQAQRGHENEPAAQTNHRAERAGKQRERKKAGERTPLARAYVCAS